MGKDDTYENIYGVELSDLPPLDEYVYDEEGRSVTCPVCGAEIVWENDNYICWNCKTVMRRDEFFDYIGVEPAGPKCITCDTIYPGCNYCPHGYIDEEQF